MTDQSDGAFGSTGAGFTAGPWVAVNDQDVDTADGRCIATVGIGVDEFPANARLIAACPTMFSYIERQAEAGDPSAIRILEDINASR
ncbi:MAG: hypothetical protein EOP20_12210 [Hyphomicrobiales bacterium]|nr:MAG: hypothetical protein EOP20_12210 [Hyphomicrobiales bacterium]